uniref:Uncharacterized protein n=1 Tax=Paulinella longichromatophora TaxID=1708747 RepID=A0A2H4ZP25_9EUKA|nr:hypothetical protein PLO_294 [Paulinella longichromatophora]
MYVIELTTRLNPISIAIERRELVEAEVIYKQVFQAMDTGTPRMINLTCDSRKDKKICVLTSEILIVQIYEKVEQSEQSINVQIAEKRRAGFRV